MKRKKEENKFRTTSYARMIDDDNDPDRPTVICLQAKTSRDKLGQSSWTVDISNAQD